MHPAPPEASQNATSVDQTQHSLPTPTQHGLPDIEQQASGGTLSTSSPSEPTPNLENTLDNVSVNSDGTQRGRSSNAGRLSRQHSSSQEGSPGSRIDEYERAYTKYRRPSDEMIFQVVPSTRDRPSKVTIDNFPNGMENRARRHLRKC